MTLLDSQTRLLERMQPRQISGSVAALRGLSVLVDQLPLPVGSLVQLESRTVSDLRVRSVRGVSGGVWGEVVGFSGSQSIVMLFGQPEGISPGTRVIGEQVDQTVNLGSALIGRVIDGLGRPIDGGPPLLDTTARPLHSRATSAMTRRRITEPLPTGVRVLDGMLTLGKGQRIGIFSGPGVGKSTLLASIARHTAADINVIALIGERGREVREFIEHALGAEGLSRSVIVVATSDESPLLRVRAANVAAAAAEYFRELGRDVMFMMDSVTRFAQAQRQVGLTVGEQPATKGYTPSVFAMMPVLLERAGAIEGGGSITGFYSVLVEGDDLSEPISDAARGILDGHIVLSRRLAGRGHYPAVAVMDSISRLADAVCDRAHIASRRILLRLIAAYSEAEELINIGAYARGSNPDCDVAIALKSAIDQFLTFQDNAPYPETCKALVDLAAAAQKHYAAHPTAARREPAKA